MKRYIEIYILIDIIYIYIHITYYISIYTYSLFFIQYPKSEYQASRAWPGKVRAAKCDLKTRENCECSHPDYVGLRASSIKPETLNPMLGLHRGRRDELGF